MSRIPTVIVLLSFFFLISSSSPITDIDSPHSEESLKLKSPLYWPPPWHSTQDGIFVPSPGTHVVEKGSIILIYISTSTLGGFVTWEDISYSKTKNGVIKNSNIGKRRVITRIDETRTYALFFKANKRGVSIVELTVLNDSYSYEFIVY